MELEDPALTCLLVCQSPGPRPQVKGFGNYDRTFHGDLTYGLRNMEEGGVVYRRDRDEYLESKQTKLNKPKNECTRSCGVET